MSAPLDDRTAKWLVGDALATVLVLGDRPLAAQLADQGHTVVVLSPAAPRTEHPEVGHVRAADGHLPFVDSCFSAVLCDGTPSPTALAGYARILEPGGLVSTYTEGFDETVGWMRRLRELLGGRTAEPISSAGYDATGLFAAPEIETFAAWEQLDMDGLVDLARHRLGAAPDEPAIRRARELFVDYGAERQPLRLRRHVTGLRCRVRKERAPATAPPPDTVLVDFR